MIKSVFFSDFRALRDVKVSLRPLTVIVGPNGSGKTTILKGLACLLELVRAIRAGMSPYNFFDGERNPLLLATQGTRGTTRVGALIGEGTVSFEFRIPSDISFDTLQQGHSTQIDWKFSIKSTSPRYPNWVDVPKDTELLDELPNPRLLKLEPAHLAAASNPGQYRSEMGETGEGLASVLALLHGRDYDRFKDLERHFCAVIPTVKRIRFDRVPVSSFMGNAPVPLTFGANFGGPTQVGEMLLFDTVGADGVPSTSMSDGTLLVLGLLTVLYTAQRSQLILLDDLEHGLHPKAQRDIVPLIRKLLQTSPGLQVIATTHSPYLVDVLEPEEVRTTTIAGTGEVLCSPLNKHPDFARWKDEMSPGEFWSVVGVGSSRVDLQACKLEYSIVSPK